MTKTSTFDNAVILTARGKYFVLGRERTSDGLLEDDLFPKFLITVYDEKLNPKPKMFFCYGMMEKEVNVDKEQNLTFIRFTCKDVVKDPHSETYGITILFSHNDRRIHITRNHLIDSGDGVVDIEGDYLYSNNDPDFNFTDHDIYRSMFNRIYKSFMVATDPSMKCPMPTRFNLDPYDKESNFTNIVSNPKFVVNRIDLLNVTHSDTIDIAEGASTDFCYIENGYNEKNHRRLFKNITSKEYDDIYESFENKIHFSLFRDESTEMYIDICKKEKEICSFLTISQYDGDKRINTQRYISSSIRIVKTLSEFDERLERIGKGFMYHISGRIADDIGSIFVKVDNKGVPGKKTEICIEVNNCCYTRKMNIKNDVADEFIKELDKFVSETYLFNPYVVKMEDGYAGSNRY